MTYYQPFPETPAPFVPARRSNTADIVATSMLMAVHAGGFVLVAFFSLFWVMGTDSCGYATCNYDNLTYAYVLTDLVGGVVLLVAMATAIVLMVRRRVAFWVPIVGMITQVVLVVASFGLLDNVVR